MTGVQCFEGRIEPREWGRETYTTLRLPDDIADALQYEGADVPEDVSLAIRQGRVSDAWNAMTPGKQRGALPQIATAKRSDTCVWYIAKLIEDVRA